MLLVALTLGCAQPEASNPTERLGGWTDHLGRAVHHRGMNVASTAKTSADHLPGFDDAAYDLLPAYGITLVRYLVFWEAIEPTEGLYDDAYLDAVALDIQRLRDRDVEVMLDFHQDVYGEGFGFTGFPRWTCDEAQYETFTPNTTSWALNYLAPEVQYCFDAFWASSELQDSYIAMATHAASRLDALVIGYDTMNEPFWGTSAQEALETGAFGDFQAAVVDALRAVSPDAWIALEPLAYTNFTGDSYLPFPADISERGGLLYAPHFYPPYAESGEGWDGTFEDEADWLNGLADQADERGAGLWLGEFGIFAENGNEVEYIRSVIDTLAARGASTAYWAFDPGQIFDGETNAPGEVFTAWQRPFVHAMPGRMVSIAHDGSDSEVVYAPVLPDLPLTIVLPEGACGTLTISTVPTMLGVGVVTTPGRIELYGEATGEQWVGLACAP